MPTCENEWDQSDASGRPADASVYKSGDADRVTLRPGGGIDVVHYDISTGPGKVRDEMRGREKLCNVLRLAWDKNTNSVWFGANHGFALGVANFSGYSCAPNTWDYGCAGVMEHVHPAINGWNDSKTSNVLLTDAYYGVSVANNGDVWFGGAIRSTRFRYGTDGDNYWQAQLDTEAKENAWNRFDIWPDAVQEPTVPAKDQRKDDQVSGMAVMADQTVWVGSLVYGLAHLDAEGRPLQYLSTDLVDRKGYVASVAHDPFDESVWAGTSWGGGVSRVQGTVVKHYGMPVFGRDLIQSRVTDIQMDASPGKRRVLVGFLGTDSAPGAIGIYSGD